MSDPLHVRIGDIEVGVSPCGAPPDVAWVETADPLDWCKFSTSSGHALLAVRPDHAALLHWIESSERGHGTAILEAVHVFADWNYLDLECIAQFSLLPWYQRRGWSVDRQFVGDSYLLRRQGRRWGAR